MGKSDYFYYHMHFENSLLKSYGFMFQEHFYNLMSSCNPNFRKIDTQGRVGDRKCDGYICTEGIFYQVYGPKDTTTAESSIQKYAVGKAEDDFLGLLDHVKNGYWEPINEYIFVLNNHRGLFPDLDEKIKYLNTKYSPIKFDILDRSKLIIKFDSLLEEQKMSICNCFAPDINICLINNTIVGNIISFLTLNNRVRDNKNKLIAPDFRKKIVWNKLDLYNSSAITMGNYSVCKLDEYLNTYNESISQDLCTIYSRLYSESKQKFPTDSDAQFNYIVDNSYSSDGLSISDEAIYNYNTYIIMSKFFESCDIFEEPPEEAE